MRIGIDPGVTGAIAFLQDDLRCYLLEDMPTMALGNKRQVNAVELAKLINRHVDEHCVAYLELVGAMPGQGVTSMFNFGVSYGVVMGVCAALKISLVLVRPNAWKRTAGLIGKPKDASRTLAQQLYPEVDLAHKKDVGRAESLLIARFGGLT